MAFTGISPRPRFGLRRGAKEYENGRLYDADFTGYGSNGIYANVTENDIVSLKSYLDGTMVDLTDNTGVFKKDEDAIVVADSNLADSKSRMFTLKMETGEKCRIFIPNVKNVNVEDVATLLGTFDYKRENGTALKPIQVAYSMIKEIVAPAP